MHHLGELVADELAQLSGEVFAQAATKGNVLAHLVATGRLYLAPVEDLERERPPNRLGLDQVADRLGPELVVGIEDELSGSLRQLNESALEVTALLYLAPHLVVRVA